MPDNLLRKLGGFYPVNDELKADLRALKREQIKLDAHQMLIRQGEKSDSLYLVESGWIFRMRHMPGGGRQIVSIALPGDFLCYESLMFACSDFDLCAKTSASVFRLATPDIRTLLKKYQGLAEALVWSTSHEEGLLAERVVSLGRRDSTERLAHLLCEIVARLELIDGPVQSGRQLPLTQEDFADMLGISVVHTVRTFKTLTESGAIAYPARKLTLMDIGKLQRIAGYDQGYLHFSQRRDVRPISAAE